MRLNGPEFIEPFPNQNGSVHLLYILCFNKYPRIYDTAPENAIRMRFLTHIINNHL